MDNNLIYGGGLAAYLGLMILIGYLVKTESKLRKTIWLEAAASACFTIRAPWPPVFLAAEF